jgi:NAD(P)H dehydrogenase (quinone)
MSGWRQKRAEVAELAQYMSVSPMLKRRGTGYSPGHDRYENHLMNILIIHAHHEARSFNAAMKDMALAELRAQGHVVEVSDLYAMNWNPVASAADFGSRANPDYLVYALEQRDNLKHGTLAPDIRAELDKLLRADLVIFNFPVYWFSMPAIMKGWIDRVLVSGICYGGMRFYDRGGLAGKKAMLSMTIGGQPHMLVEGGIHGELNDMLRHILRGTLAYTGMTVLPPFVAHHVPYISHDERTALLEQYRSRLRAIETLQGLQYVSMSQFDDRLNPLCAHPAKIVYDDNHADKKPHPHTGQPQGTHP